MYSRKEVEKYHNIHQGIHQNGKGEHIISIQCQLDANGPYHDQLLEDGTIMYIGEGGLEVPQQEVTERPKRGGGVHRMYGNLALKTASISKEDFHVINKYRDGSYEYLGKWVVTGYEYSAWKGFPAHFRFYLNRVVAPIEYIGKYGRIIDQSNTLRKITTSSIPHRLIYVGGMRMVRDNQAVEQLKKTYDHSCVICRKPLSGIIEPITDVHYIKPITEPHLGPNVEENMIILCPNHRVQFEAGVLGFGDKYRVVDINGNLICTDLRLLHSLKPEYLEYHNTHIFKGKF